MQADGRPLEQERQSDETERSDDDGNDSCPVTPTSILARLFSGTGSRAVPWMSNVYAWLPSAG